MAGELKDPIFRITFKKKKLNETKKQHKRNGHRGFPQTTGKMLGLPLKIEGICRLNSTRQSVI